VVQKWVRPIKTASLSQEEPEIRFPNQGHARVETSESFELIDRWSSGNTWGCISSDHCKPAEGDLIELPTGSRILLDESPPKLKAILISGGVLKVENKDIDLNVEYLIITNGGRFIIGSEEQPATESINIYLHGHVGSQQLPLYGSNVIAVHSGSLEIYGKVKTSITTLAKSAVPGDRNITVHQSSGRVQKLLTKVYRMPHFRCVWHKLRSFAIALASKLCKV